MDTETWSKKTFEKKNVEFVSSYVNGIWWDEGFYPRYSEVLDFDQSLSSTGRQGKEEWKDLLEIAAEEKKRSARQALIELKECLEETFRDKLLNKFIDHEFKGATSIERTYIKKKLQEIRERSTPHHLNQELKSFLSEGLTGIRKKISTETSWSVAKKYGKYLWTTIMGIIEILILLAILNVSDSNATTLIILGLAMIYLQIRGMGFTKAFLYPRILEDLIKEFLQIRKLLGDKNIASADELNKLIKTIRTQEAESYVQIGFLVLMCVIVMWKLAVIVLS